MFLLLWLWGWDLWCADKLSSVFGTPFYCAPEVLRGSYGKEGDMWSCGIILYILLSGIPPFCATSVDEIRETIEGEFWGLWLDVSVDARDLIRNMLVRDPMERLTAAKILGMLSMFC